MFKNVEIKNFQSHKLSILEFHPGVNAIIGASDQGKTAVLRALRWLCTNKPIGDSFRSDWGGDTDVVLDLTEGKKIIRHKTNSKNIYQLDGEDFASFNKGVPAEIEDVLQMGPINWQAQMDPPFVLSWKSGDVAKELNRIVNLENIDTSLSYIAGKGRTATSRRKELEATAERLQIDLQEFDNLDEMEELVVEVERLEGVREQAITDKNKIEETNKALEDAGRSIRSLKSLLSVQTLVSETETLHRKRVSLEEEAVAIRYNLVEMDKVEISLQKIQTLCDDSVSKLIDGILEDEEEHNKSCQLLGDLQSLLKDIQASSVYVEKGRQNTRELIEEFKREAPEECPLCGGEWDA